MGRGAKAGNGGRFIDNSRECPGPALIVRAFYGSNTGAAHTGGHRVADAEFLVCQAAGRGYDADCIRALVTKWWPHPAEKNRTEPICVRPYPVARNVIEQTFNKIKEVADRHALGQARGQLAGHHQLASTRL
jgi:hypothetical protein